MIKVSVVIPVYNTEEYVEEAIMSVLKQSLKEIEVIIVNDGSPDNSEEIIQNIHDDRIRYFKKENGGLSDARNYGFKYVRGKYVYFLDSDDYIEEDFLLKAYKKMEETGSDMLQTRLIYFGDCKTKLSNYPLSTDKKELLAKGQVITGDKLYRTSVIRDNNLEYIKGYYYEDIPFFHAFVLSANKFTILDEGNYWYRQRKGSITATFNKKLLDIIPVLEDAIRYYKEYNVYDTYHDEIEYFTTRIILGSSMKRLFNIKDKSKRKEAITETYDFLVKTFPEYKKNPYLKKGFKNFIFKHMNLKLLLLLGGLKWKRLNFLLQNLMLEEQKEF